MSWFVSWKACSRFKKCALTPIFLKTGGAGRTIKWLKKLLWHFLEGSTSKDPNGKSFCGIPPSPIKEMKWYVVSVPLGDWKLWSRLHKALHLGVLFKISRDLISQKSGGLTPPPQPHPLRGPWKRERAWPRTWKRLAYRKFLIALQKCSK